MGEASITMNNVIPSIVSESTFPAELQKDTIIKEIALTALKEMTASLAFSAITCLFVATPLGMATLVVGNLAIIVIVALIRIKIASMVADKVINAADKDIKYFFDYLEFSQNMMFAVTNLATRSILFHEFGHALAAKALYVTKVTVKVFPFIGGVMEKSPGALTSLGNYFGHKVANLLITAAGPAVNLITSVALIGMAHHLKESHPKLSGYFNVMATLEVLSITEYALSAFYHPIPGHDFIVLAAGGIHPLVSVAVLVGVPVIFKLGLMFADNLKKQDNTDTSLTSAIIGKPRIACSTAFELCSSFNHF